MRSWRLASAVKAVERIKAMLLAERTGAEWEILEGEEWAGAIEEVEEGEVLEGRPEAEEGMLGLGRTGVLVKPTGMGKSEREGEGVVSGMESGKEREKTNGWMKVKSRSLLVAEGSEESGLR